VDGWIEAAQAFFHPQGMPAGPDYSEDRPFTTPLHPPAPKIHGDIVDPDFRTFFSTKGRSGPKGAPVVSVFSGR